MAFSDALDENVLPRTLGDVRLHYDRSLFIGEARTRLPYGYAPAALGVGAVASGLATGVVLLFPAPGQSSTLALTLAASAVLLGAAAIILSQRVWLRRRWALNFATESFRLDRASALGSPESVVVPFDWVREVSVERGAKGVLSLHVSYVPREDAPAAETVLLIDRIPARETEPLARVWRMLHRAFGLRDAAPTPSLQPED